MQGHDGGVLPRVLAAAAAAWCLLYLAAYLWIINSQNGAVAWWYVALVVLAALSLVASAVVAFSAWHRATLTVGFTASALAVLAALTSIGVLLAPTAAATAIALLVRGRREAQTKAAGQVKMSARPRRPSAR